MRVREKQRVFPGAALILLCCLLPGASGATPIFYPGTGHYYDFIWHGRITWTDAFVEAQTHYYDGLQGYLATITSQGENDILYQTYGHIFWEGWLGGWQSLGSAPAENWHWVTGEPWDYTNWARGEPNDGAGTGEECYLQMWGYGTVDPAHWNDDANDTNLGNIGGYFVEYSAQPIPEPAAFALLALGLGALAVGRIRRRG